MIRGQPSSITQWIGGTGRRVVPFCLWQETSVALLHTEKTISFEKDACYSFPFSRRTFLSIPIWAEKQQKNPLERKNRIFSNSNFGKQVHVDFKWRHRKPKLEHEQKKIRKIVKKIV